MAAIENEPVRQVSPLIPEAQPRSAAMAKCRSGKKCVRGRRSKWAWRRAFAVIVGVSTIVDV